MPRLRLGHDGVAVAITRNFLNKFDVNSYYNLHYNF